MSLSDGTYTTADKLKVFRYDADSKIILDLIQVVNDLIRRVDKLEKAKND